MLFFNPVANLMANELNAFNKISSVVMSSCIYVAVESDMFV